MSTFSCSKDLEEILKIKVGVIGLGVGEQHLKTYASNRNCEVIAICDFSADKLRQVASQYPSLRMVTEDSSSVLSNPEINLVSIASWDNYHAGQILDAIQYGKHLFVEKPLCISESEGISIKEALDSNPQIKIGTNLILRLYPRFVEVKKRLRAGEMGELISIEGDYNYGRLHKVIDGWRGTVDGYSGIYGGGIHIVDLFLWLTGERVIEVAAYGGKVATKNTGFKNFDLLTAILKFESGLIGKVSVNLGCVYPHFHRFSLYGTKATIENTLDGLSMLRHFDSDSQDSNHDYDRETIEASYPGAGKGEYLVQFIASIVNDTPPPISQSEIFNGLAVCNAIEQSAHSGKLVRVNYF